MKYKVTLLFIMIMLLFFSSPVARTDSGGGGRFEITTVTMKFEETNATFTVQFRLDPLASLYISFFGSRSLEPKVQSIFTGFNDAEIIKLGMDRAVVSVKDVSRSQKYIDSSGNVRKDFFHDSHPFAGTIPHLLVYTPDSPRPKELFYTNSTPNTFYSED
ncbi:MAG TPA: hypothetical protein HA257_08800 [Candidatus Methanoperedenaceae archaeon]|nr:hypothetical protein [Candidatus Methanoperedenaceae archaeon]